MIYITTAQWGCYASQTLREGDVTGGGGIALALFLSTVTVSAVTINYNTSVHIVKKHTNYFNSYLFSLKVISIIKIRDFL